MIYGFYYQTVEIIERKESQCNFGERSQFITVLVTAIKKMYSYIYY